MSEPIELVIFDCDGVLVDSERLAVRIESRLITELGWPLSEDDILHRFVGRSDAYMVAEIEQTLGLHAQRECDRSGSPAGSPLPSGSRATTPWSSKTWQSFPHS